MVVVVVEPVVGGAEVVGRVVVVGDELVVVVVTVVALKTVNRYDPPQNSEAFPSQVMEQSEAGVLGAVRVFPQ